VDCPAVILPPVTGRYWSMAQLNTARSTVDILIAQTAIENNLEVPYPL
jgi:predicted nucleic acid-binding protein